MREILDRFIGSMPSHWWVWLLIFAIVFISFLAVRSVVRKKTRMRQIDRMTGEEFERYLALKFKGMGYGVRQTKKTGDYGADLILTDKKTKEKIVVQAKRYAGNVGVEAIQQVSAARLHYDADAAFVVTNSYFTRGAETLAATNDVALFDRDWVEETAKKRIQKNREDDCAAEEEALEIRFERTVLPPDGCAVTEGSVERLIEEYLIDRGYTILTQS